MIKVLKLSNKSVTRFSTNKKWNYSTLDSGSNIILEQGDGVPLFSSSVNKLSTEQNSSEFQLNMRFGKKISGTFFSKDSKHFDETKELLNYDGSYQRVVYNSIKHLFYNDYGTVGGNDELNNFYKNPLNLFGSETGIYSSSSFNSKTLEEDPRSERRVLKDEVTVLEVPSNVFGEKIKPGTLKITDHSSDYDSIEIVDDGNTNLIVGSGNFNNVNEMNLNSNIFGSISETTSSDNKINIDYTDLSYGYTLDTHGDFLLSGAPILSDSASENQSGRASLHKYNPKTQKHEIIKNFYCPFTQNGIAHENRNDNCEFILTELDDIISSEDFLVNDDFGKSVSINDTICAIGSPGSHINGRHTEQATGHVFVYHKDKGGKENWGIVNVFEGTPNSEFGHSVSINEDFIAVGSPNFEDGIGCVYLFKKTKRTKEHPWIKTSSVYDSYKWNDLLEKYEGIPKQDDTKYKDYVKTRDSIVSRRIEKIKAELKRIKETGVISELEYLDRLPTKDDFSEIFPFEYLYTASNECGETDTPWFKEKIWSKNTHPATRCNSKNSDKHYNKSMWPGYMTDEKTDLYIPNPDHEQNKDNKWAYRWKLQNVEGGPESIYLFGDDSDCELDMFTTFEDATLGSFGDSKLPLVEYSETPKYAVGDVTFDLVGVIKSPDKDIKRFGEKVVLNKNKLYISSYSTDNPKCFMFQKTTNEFGCEVWDLKNTISETQLLGHASNYKIDDTLNYAQINHYDSYFEIEICPKQDNYDKWIYSFDKPILNSEKAVVGGKRVDKCDSKCRGTEAYNYYSRFRHIGLKEAGHLKHNYGEPTEVVSGETGKFYKRPTNYDPYTQPLLLSQNETIELSWKRFRENVSFAYTNVPPGKHKSKMTIYSNKAKLKDGTYDEKETLAEIEANETLDNKKVRLILNSGLGESEYFYEFLFRGSPTGTHYTLNELVDKIDYACTLPPNSGSFVDISDKLNDTLDNHGNCKFFSKEESANSYSEPWSADDEMAISWKNFRENVSFSYPSVKSGNHPSFMTIYANEAKLKDGTYDPIHTLAEIGASETLNGKKVRLTFNSGFVNGDEYYYDFIYRGSIEGTHYTLNELKQSLDYDCTLPPNLGESISIADEDFDDPLDNKQYARFFSKGLDSLSYVEPWSDDDTIALSWKTVRENVSFSYPAVKSGKQPSFMTIYSNEAKQDDGTYNPLYTLAEIGAQETLNGEKVRLIFNTGFAGGDEYYYDFIYRGSIEGTHYTLNELRTELDEGYAETQLNSGDIRYIKNYDKLNIHKRCRLPKFYTKSESQLSYVEPYSSDDHIAISWKNFRENISFSYPNIKAGSEPSFMTIYSNEAKEVDGTYDPIYTLAEIGANNALNGQKVKLYINADNCEYDNTYYYEFIYDGSVNGTHYTLNELKSNFDYECTLPPNLGKSVELKSLDDRFKENNGSRFFSKPDDALSFLDTNSTENTMGLSWKNFRENVSFSYPRVKQGTKPSFMAIYSNDAKRPDGTYDPMYMLAEIGAHETLNNKMVRLTINSGFVNGDEHYYEFLYRGSIQGTHFTLNELKTSYEYECTLPPNHGGYVSISDKNFKDALNNKSNAKFYSKDEDGLSYVEPWGDEKTIALSWKNVRENVSFSYPAVKSGSQPSFMTIYSNEAKQDDGTYDPIHTLAEIGAQDTLNGKKVRLTFNTGFVGGVEYYYEFIYTGSAQGTHYTLNELKQSFDYECTLPPNMGKYVSLSKIEFDDYLDNNENAKFFTKSTEQSAYIQNHTSKDEIAISWKNFRENVSFSYPKVKSGNEPSFMSIYSNDAKDKNGRYDPIKTLAELGADTGLNGKIVRLTFNTGSTNDDEFYYEFKYDGSLTGKNYTLNELAENDLLQKVESGRHIQRKTNSVIEFKVSEKVRRIKVEKIQKEKSNKITTTKNKKLNTIKSFGLLEKNKGSVEVVDIKLRDDILQSSDSLKFYSRGDNELYKENTKLKNEVEIDWNNFREGVSFYYPIVSSEDNNTPVKMTIYSDHDILDGYDKNRKLAEITTNSGLNGEVVRLKLEPKESDSIFYEFMFDGQPGEGSHYTLEELSETIPNDRLFKSNDTTPTTNSGTIKNQVRASSIPLIIYSNDAESCKVKIDKNKITSGRHNLYILLVDSKLKPIGKETKIEMYNNPSFYNLEDRRNLVKKSYGYSNNIKSEFGRGIDASDKYLVIGNPSDRVYYLNSEKSCVGGSAFVYRVNDDDLNFIEKIYGEDEYENNFSSGFGNDVSILGSNFLVGSYSHEMSDMTLTETNSSKRLDIEDLEFGVSKFTDEIYTTTDALITDYEVDLSSEFGDALIKVKLDGLNIDKSLISESTLRANFIDTGNETIRITQVEGENTESVNGTYRLVKSPIQIKSGCEIDFSENYRVYINKNNWSIFFDKLRGAWILTDTPNVSVEYEIPSNWMDVLKYFERINLLDKFNILTEEMINTALSLYNIIDEDITTTWRARKQKEIPKNNIRYADLFRELESVTKLKLNPTIIERLFYLYSSNSRKKIDISILNRWKTSNQNIGVLPFIYELDSVNPISLNFDLLIKTLEVYNLKDYEIAKTWSVKLGYEYLLGDLIDDIRPKYHDNLSLYNLRLISKIAFDFINDRNYSDSDISKGYFKNLVKEDIAIYLDKWKPHVESGFLLSDIFKDMNENININFSLSDEASEDDLPTKFSYGVGTLSNMEIKVFSNNDTAGDNLSLTWGVYRDATKIVGNQIYFYVNLLPGAKLDETVVFVYNSIKSSINGYAYYYSIENETGKCKQMKRMKTNKKKYSCKKQYGFAVSLSNNFICVGSPVLGNFNIDELITFGGSSVVSFGTSEKMYIEYSAIHPSYISELGKNIVGTIISYDHSAIKDNKKHYIGNVFYKNGVIALTDRDGYFTNVLSNSGVSGFELEFKSMHTLYENEILCKVEPHEFNFSTNPTAVATGRINYDINNDGRFDIIDASYIYKYIMGEIGPIEKSDEEIIEEHNAIKLGIKLNKEDNWPKQDLLMTESEDALLMDLFVNSEILEKRPDYEKVLINLKEKYENGDFDINGDGKTDEVDANLLLRYFLGRRGNYLTRNLISKYDDSTRKDSSSIIKYLDEQTGKNLGKEILKDFQDFSENDKKDSLGSYLAPYATTIGLYSGLDLVMVAKLGKPVKILPNYPINFLIKFDN